jgi:hypothetical protein
MAVAAAGLDAQGLEAAIAELKRMHSLRQFNANAATANSTQV